MKKHIEDPITVLSGKPSIDKIWSRTYSLAQQDINFNEMSIWEYIYLANYGREDEVALRYFGKTMTFKELYKKVDQFALNLVDQGVKQGDVVTICMPNTPEGVIAFLATNKIGAVASMIHPLLKGNDILDTLESTRSKVMVMADTSYNEVSKIIDNTDLQKVYVVSPGDSMPVISNIQPGIKFIYFAKEA
jgi:long-chain acyl-CoA synthetase